MLFLRQSTASQEILLGPFLDSTDGNTAETALTIANTDIKLWAEGATTEFSKTAGGATHIAAGRYYAVLDATDTATVGKLEVNVHVAGALAVRREYHVLEEAVYDALFAASAPGYVANAPVNVAQFGGTNGTFAAGRPEANASHIGGTAAATAVVRADLRQLLGTALTETAAGRIAAALVAFLDVPTPTLTAAGTNQTGDSFARIGSTGSGLTSLATAAQVTGMSVNTRANLNVPVEIENPDASTLVYKVRLHLFDVEGNMEAPDSAPTVTLTNAAGTNRAARLSASSNPSTGVYTWDYTATAGDAEEQLVWVFTVVEGGLTRTYPATSYVVEETAYRFSSTDRSNLNAIKAATDNLPADPADASVIATSFASVQSALTVIDDFLDTEMAAALAIAAKLDTALVADGGVWQFTVNALELAPSGGGGGATDWNADERTAIRTILGVPASGTTPDAPTAGALKVIDDLLDTEVGAIKAKTDLIPADPADASDIVGSFATVNSTLAVIDGRIDTEIISLVASVASIISTVGTILTAVDNEVALIKAKTDLIPAEPADASDIPTAVQNADALLARSIAAGANGPRTVSEALQASRNRVAFDVPAVGQFTVFAEDDTTPSWTGTYITDAGAETVVEINPA